MTNGPREAAARARLLWLWIVPLAAVGWLSLTAAGGRASHRFIASLRIARPEAVSVNIPAFSGPTGTHRLLDAVASMLADTVRGDSVAVDTAVGDAAAAARLAGFAPALPGARSDSPRLSVERARMVTIPIDAARLHTILVEAGRPGMLVPPGVDGAALTLRTPTAVRAEYGHCPVAAGQTLRDQLVAYGPPTADSGDCVVLIERGPVTGTPPAGLDMSGLAGIALEIAGMSPVEAAAFQKTLDWRAALALRMPRFIRSYEAANVVGRPAMLLNMGGRRGPAWELIWQRDGRVFALAGYGSASDAVPLAESIHCCTEAM